MTASGQPAPHLPTDPPEDVDPTAWARLSTADLVRTYIGVPGPPSRALPLHARTTIETLIVEVCEGNRARADEVVSTGLNEDILFTEAWLRLRYEWHVRERLLSIEITNEETDETLTVAERRDGGFTLSVSTPAHDSDGGYATMTVPARKMYRLAAAVNRHNSPVLPTSSTGGGAAPAAEDRS